MVADDVVPFAGLKLEELAVTCELLDGPPPLAYAGDVIRRRKINTLIACNLTASATVNRLSLLSKKHHVRFGSKADMTS
jgi:hypothetical protein